MEFFIVLSLEKKVLGLYLLQRDKNLYPKLYVESLIRPFHWLLLRNFSDLCELRDSDAIIT